MTRGFSTQHPASLHQGAVNVPVTHCGPDKRNAQFRKRFFEAEIRHYRANDTAGQGALPLTVV